jgi:hypothetical protein
MRTLWLFKRVKDFPSYIICSDGTVYNRLGLILKPIMSRQGYERIQFKDKNRRVLKSRTNLILSHFSLRRYIELPTDCPF